MRSQFQSPLAHIFADITANFLRLDSTLGFGTKSFRVICYFAILQYVS